MENIFTFHDRISSMEFLARMTKEERKAKQKKKLWTKSQRTLSQRSLINFLIYRLHFTVEVFTVRFFFFLNQQFLNCNCSWH